MSKPGYTSISLRSTTRELLGQLQNEMQRERRFARRSSYYCQVSAEDVVLELVKKELAKRSSAKSMDSLETVHRPGSRSIDPPRRSIENAPDASDAGRSE